MVEPALAPALPGVEDEAPGAPAPASVPEDPVPVVPPEPEAPLSPLLVPPAAPGDGLGDVGDVGAVAPMPPTELDVPDASAPPLPVLLPMVGVPGAPVPAPGALAPDGDEMGGVLSALRSQAARASAATAISGTATQCRKVAGRAGEAVGAAKGERVSVFMKVSFAKRSKGDGRPGEPMVECAPACPGRTPATKQTLTGDPGLRWGRTHAARRPPPPLPAPSPRCCPPPPPAPGPAPWPPES